MTTTTEQPLGVIDTIHGMQVHDPYRWLEDRSSPETERWIERQTAKFGAYCDSLKTVAGLEKRVRECVEVESLDQIGRVRDRYFYRKRLVGEQQSSLYVMEANTSRERVLVDSSKYDPYVSFAIHHIAPSGALLAYELRRGGEHTKEIHVVDVDTGMIWDDHIANGLSHGFSFLPSDNGYCYSHEFIAENANDSCHSIRYHELGSPSSSDRIVFEHPRTSTSKLLLRTSEYFMSAVYYDELNGTPVVNLYSAPSGSDGTWSCVHRETNRNIAAAFHRTRLFALSVQREGTSEILELNPDNGGTKCVIHADSEHLIRGCILVNDRIFVMYLDGTEVVIRMLSLEGKPLGDLPLAPGKTWSLQPIYSPETTEIFLKCESFTESPQIFVYDITDGSMKQWWDSRASTPRRACCLHSMTCTARDGQEISYSVLAPTDFAAKGPSPVIMTAYGSSGFTQTPQYSAFISLMLEAGFLLIRPSIRGGGERGKQWQEAARRRNKQQAFSDFIDVAEDLCHRGITSPDKLGIFGGSFSGLLVAATSVQRPDLFGAVLCIAPLLDMIRYHIYDRAWIWSYEFGTADDEEDFRALLSYSPYHRVDDSTDYPAMLFVCGDNDTRCNPAHVRKMAALLQGRAAQVRPILVDYSRERGHAPTMPTNVKVSSIVRRIAFFCRELQISHEPWRTNE